jgi:hypothetical protein
MSVQYRVIVAKNDERADGPDDADVVLAVPVSVAAEATFDASVEFMRGRLKAQGASAAIFEVLQSGAATESLSRLASQI